VSPTFDLAVPTERYVTRHELAELMHVSPRTIDAFVAEGMPSETWGMKRTRRFLPSQALKWASERSSLSSDRDRLQTATGESRKE
jgi:phage terminase Nu1 subunit (DNA packaging protein)